MTSSISLSSHQVARENLSTEARQLVTSSKQLVKSITDSSNGQDDADLPSHLSACLTLLRRLTHLSADLAVHTSCPLQTRNLVLKVRTRDIRSYREVLGSKISALPGLAGTSTYVSMQPIIDDTM